MGTKPDKSRFLGHSIGLQLDESPVVAAGFDRPPVGGTMAIEPKAVYAEGGVGSEDAWVRDEDGMRPITADGALPWVMRMRHKNTRKTRSARRPKVGTKKAWASALSSGSRPTGPTSTNSSSVFAPCAGRRLDRPARPVDSSAAMNASTLGNLVK